MMRPKSEERLISHREYKDYLLDQTFMALEQYGHATLAEDKRTLAELYNKALLKIAYVLRNGDNDPEGDA